jgi:hypothetical protein
MRTALGIVLGILVAFLVQSGVDAIGSLIYPYAITDVWDRRQYSEAIAARPIGALLLTIAGYFLAGLSGGAAAKLIARRNAACWVPAGVMAATVLLLAFGYPFPTWSLFAMFAAPLIGGLIANHLVGERVVGAAPATAVPAEPEADERL